MTQEVRPVPISPNEASKALHELSATELASASAYRYAQAAPHLILWGVIWIAGYGVTYLDTRLSVAWIPLALVGAVGSGWLGARARPPERHGYWRQSVATFAAIVVAL